MNNISEVLLSLKKKIMPEGSPFKYFIIGGIAFYVFLCLLHFSSGRPLWLDERSIHYILTEYAPNQLFGPFSNQQAFPRVYLFAVHRLGNAFDLNIYSIRLFSLVFMMLGFYMWLRIFRKLEGKGIGYFLFILSWCGSAFMSYYAAELKQFSCDVFVASIFAWILLNQKNVLDPEKIDPLQGLKYFFMPFLLLISYPAYFFVAIPLYNLILASVRNKRNIIYAVIYIMALIPVVFISYNFDARYARSLDQLHLYWTDYFILTTSFPAFIQSFTEGFRNIFVRWFLEISLIRRILTVFLPFALYFLGLSGARSLKENKGKILSLSSLIIALLTGMAIAGMKMVYPFTGTRVTLFLAPFIFYAIIKGILLFREKIPWLYSSLTTLYILTLISTSIVILKKYIMLY